MASNVTGGQQIKHFMLTLVLKDEFKHDIPIGNNFNVIYDNKDANLQVGDLLTKVDCESINHEMYLKRYFLVFMILNLIVTVKDIRNENVDQVRQRMLSGHNNKKVTLHFVRNVHVRHHKTIEVQS